MLCKHDNKFHEVTQVFYNNNWENMCDYGYCKDCGKKLWIRDYKYAYFDWANNTKFRAYKEDVTDEA